jgi:hypothetical protein
MLELTVGYSDVGTDALLKARNCRAKFVMDEAILRYVAQATA